MSEITRREFVRGVFTSLGVAVLGSKTDLGSLKIGGRGEVPNVVEQSVWTREECFKPFGKGFAEWQYVAFQYDSVGSGRFGVIISISELTPPGFGLKVHKCLVMRHSLETGETVQRVYDGARTFDEGNSAYAFTDSQGNRLVSLSYDKDDDRYLLDVATKEFDSGEMGSGGLVLRPQGGLILVSKDGNFTVASDDGGSIVANYYADHIRVETIGGKIVGYGRRDSQNLEQVGLPRPGLDIDHTWVHATGVSEDEKRFFLTAWVSKTGGSFRFADIRVMDPITDVEEFFAQFNEKDDFFGLKFSLNPAQQETSQEQEGDLKSWVARGGEVVASNRDEVLFDLEVHCYPGQVVDLKGAPKMVEAHGKITEGYVLGKRVKLSDSVVLETTEETYASYLPIVCR